MIYFSMPIAYFVARGKDGKLKPIKFYAGSGYEGKVRKRDLFKDNWGNPISFNSLVEARRWLNQNIKPELIHQDYVGEEETEDPGVERWEQEYYL